MQSLCKRVTPGAGCHLAGSSWASQKEYGSNRRGENARRLVGIGVAAVHSC
jgi:hypothetical protein